MAAKKGALAEPSWSLCALSAHGEQHAGTLPAMSPRILLDVPITFAVGGGQTTHAPMIHVTIHGTPTKLILDHRLDRSHPDHRARPGAWPGGCAGRGRDRQHRRIGRVMDAGVGERGDRRAGGDGPASRDRADGERRSASACPLAGRLELDTASLASVAEMPPVAEAAVVRVLRAIVATVAASRCSGLAAADEDRLRGTAALDPREVAIDELAVRDDAHAGHRHRPL